MSPREAGLQELKGSAWLPKVSTSYFFTARVPLTDAAGARVSPLSVRCAPSWWVETWSLATLYEEVQGSAVPELPACASGRKARYFQFTFPLLVNAQFSRYLEW